MDIFKRRKESLKLCVYRSFGFEYTMNLPKIRVDTCITSFFEHLGSYNYANHGRPKKMRESDGVAKFREGSSLIHMCPN